MKLLYNYETRRPWGGGFTTRSTMVRDVGEEVAARMEQPDAHGIRVRPRPYIEYWVTAR